VDRLELGHASHEALRAWHDRAFHAVLGPQVAARGAFRVEARALAANELALRWLGRLGATQRCRLPGYGKNSEDFFLNDWTREAFTAGRASILE